MSARIYIEGGGESKELRVRCREGFRRLFERCGLAGRMPRLVACGGRDDTFDDFNTAHQSLEGDRFVAMLVDSEDPIEDIELTWAHLTKHDGWRRPKHAKDDSVLLMVTCMETWIVADRTALRNHYDVNFRESALPSLNKIEARQSGEIQDALLLATQECRNAYAKGKRSFEIVGKVDPEALRKRLPSFRRVDRILHERL